MEPSSGARCDGASLWVVVLLKWTYSLDGAVDMACAIGKAPYSASWSIRFRQLGSGYGMVG